MTHLTRPAPIRELHVVDVENLALDSHLTVDLVAELRKRYCRAVGIGHDAHVVVATSAATTAVEAGLGWQCCRLLFENGQDGADNALLQVMLTENVVGRYDRVVIGSGDHAFAPAARYLRSHGVQVVVVTATRRSISNALRKQADRVVVLDQLAVGDGEAA